jgi:hypothetical protein
MARLVRAVVKEACFNHDTFRDPFQCAKNILVRTVNSTI